MEALKRHKVPWETWGTENRRSLSAFMEYAANDRFHVRNNLLDGPLIVDVHTVVVRVYHESINGWMELFEECQIFPNGIRIERPQFDGVGETIKRSETVLMESAKRCLKEELSFKDPSAYVLKECFRHEIRDPVVHDKWPDPEGRVLAVYNRYIHECSVSENLYDESGYVEETKDGRKIHFKWRPRPIAPFCFSE